MSLMDYLHDYPDPLDLDKPGYYFPKFVEFFPGMEYEYLQDSKWVAAVYDEDFVNAGYLPSALRVRYLQAKDILSLGFGRSATGMPLYTRGAYSIEARRLFDPTFAKLRLTINGVTVWEGICKNKSELKRILTINETSFEDSE